VVLQRCKCVEKVWILQRMLAQIVVDESCGYLLGLSPVMEETTKPEFDYDPV
jgi:hypothetical protein